MIELLPGKGTFAPSDDVVVEARGLTATATLSLSVLGEKIAEAKVSAAEPVASFGVLPTGGYGIDADGGVHGALDVLADPFERLRYGFVSDYAADRDVEGVADNVRRLHLNAVQFYDWMYRHADLLPPTDEFTDTLGRAVSLDTVRRLVRAVSDAGAAPLGYAAVYAVGAEHRDAWNDAGLDHADGTPWMLADFLWNVDPADERWLDHFTADLRRAVETVGFAGFHLDQFGAPKRAQRRDGSIVDLARAFPALIERVRASLPDARLVFNNVNDFPTEATARAPQDAVYIEVWSPHDRLDHLAGLITKARAVAPDRPVSLAAYLSVYARSDAGALAALRLELATVFSHGATCLLHGEEDAILTDPYYVRHERLDEAGQSVTRRYYDFAVRYGDLLFDRAALDVTRTHSGGINKELEVLATEPVTTDCEPGALWARVIESETRLLVSLIALTGQGEVHWDRAKQPSAQLRGVRIAAEQVGTSLPRVFFASPEDSPAPLPLEVRLVDGRVVADIPAFTTWALVWIEKESS